ncbi:hypothetical protein FNV43_RR09364 [Rhamnella rubrinervis]|uniref:VOC domain-containing protein n=1 Tax=Rhamnella rubrinervis TaxID=2594499 RepID=A0A8K0H9V0_9ROSA|nr:hypothetical protein FNV43_RR09364 [Rhamnella rubrinervis]
MAASFRWILQLHRDVPKAARFYSEGLDFTVNVCTWRWAELHSGPLKLALIQSPKYSSLSLDSVSNAFHLFECLPAKANYVPNTQSDIHSHDHVIQKGYSSLLSFTVTDINSTITKLMALGAELDGSIKYEVHGKVAAVRCIDGHMLGLYEPA